MQLTELLHQLVEQLKTVTGLRAIVLGGSYAHGDQRPDSARTIHCLVQALYALNETYYLSEKQLARELATFTLLPANFLARVNAILGHPGTNGAELLDALERTEELYRECVELR